MTREQPSNAFLATLHDTFGVPAATVEDLVRRATGRPAVMIERVVHGYDNEVYRASTGDVAVFVRIKRFGEDTDFSGELWAMESARAVGVPVPDVLLVDEVATEEGRRAVMVLAAATGTPIENLEPHPSARRSTALRHAGETLARLHTMPAPGFWRSGDDGTWPLQDWSTLMDGFIAERVAEIDVLLPIGITSVELDRMIALMNGYAHDYPCTQPVLCHGDFIPDHIFVDSDLQVSAVIDFGMYGGGPIVGDMALINFTLAPADVDAMLSGYGNPDAEFRRAIDLHTIGVAIGHLAHHVTIGDTQGVSTGAVALRRALERL